jgi:hypothetical protein
LEFEEQRSGFLTHNIKEVIQSSKELKKEVALLPAKF